MAQGANPEAERKLKELIVYVLDQRAGDPSLTRTKLAKILWYSDFGAFRELGEAITGWPYIKEEYGPMPQSMLILERDLAEGEGRIHIIAEQTPSGKKRTRYELVEGSRLADTSYFSEQQLEYVQHVLWLYRNAWASYLSHRSHQDSVGWNAAEKREVIPYEVDLLSNEPLTDAEIRRGQEVAAILGLQDRRDDDIPF
jgi:hypothetical protein